MQPIGEGINKNIISIHYPGVVKNESKMLETLGGIRNISWTYCEKNRSLKLRMRPDDVFCKPLSASRTPVIGLILKIKIKKKKKEVISYEVIGNVIEEFKFDGLCDFQFLPTSKDECLYDKIVPQGIDTDWLKKECSYFLPPVAFSRMDSVQNINLSKVATEENEPEVIGQKKRKRFGYTKCITFDNPEVPIKPKDMTIGSLSLNKMLTQESLQKLKKLFEERPIYSKSAIYCISKLPLVQLKMLLPFVAYHFTNGPWRALWVRFGYDPRKDPSSRIYQTLDYRVRSHFGKEEVKHKRGYLGMSQNKNSQSGKNTSVITKNPIEVEKEEKSDEMYHIFQAGVVPPSRVCYYQYCDLHVPEIQSMIENLPMIDENAICNEFHGWLPKDMADACREIMNKYVLEEVKRRNELAVQSTSQTQMTSHNLQYSSSESDFTDPE